MASGNRVKIIVFSGHGAWALGNDGFVEVPVKCSIRFYTLNMKMMSDAFGGELDQGKITGVEPDQEGGPFMSVPNMRLYPPTDLYLQTPDPDNWHVLNFGDPLDQSVPVDNKNIQVRIWTSGGSAGSAASAGVRGSGSGPYAKGVTLKTLFKFLDPAIRTADRVVFIWAACRKVNLKDAGGRDLGGENAGVNTVQR